MAGVKCSQIWQQQVLPVWAAGQPRPSAPPLCPPGGAGEPFPESPLQAERFQAGQSAETSQNTNNVNQAKHNTAGAHRLWFRLELDIHVWRDC